jgi:hypothetical protein
MMLPASCRCFGDTVDGPAEARASARIDTAHTRTQTHAHTHTHTRTRTHTHPHTHPHTQAHGEVHLASSQHNGAATLPSRRSGGRPPCTPALASTHNDRHSPLTPYICIYADALSLSLSLSPLPRPPFLTSSDDNGILSAFRSGDSTASTCDQTTSQPTLAEHHAAGDGVA